MIDSITLPGEEEEEAAIEEELKKKAEDDTVTLRLRDKYSLGQNNKGTVVFRKTNMSNFSRPNRHRAPMYSRVTRLASKPELERDSGFSDASSEYLSAVDLTDTEDAGRHGTLVPTVQDRAGPQVTMMGDSYTGLSPMIIMNNFVLKQPSLMAPAKKQHGYSSPMDVMPQSQVVFLQPMLSNGNGAGSLKPCSENVRQSRSYMPILKSYPKIAPHPADATNKKMGSSKMRVSSGSGYDQRHRRHRHSSRLSSSPSFQSVPQTPNKPSCNTEPVGSQSEVAELQESSLSLLTGNEPIPPYADEIRTDGMYDDQDPSMDTNKQKRFSNTYNILNKSGLLGITMRTKQLIKENKRTQGQLQQLREQTGLLLEALSSGEPQLWSKLQLSLQHSDKEQWAAKAQEAMG